MPGLHTLLNRWQNHFPFELYKFYWYIRANTTRFWPWRRGGHQRERQADHAYAAFLLRFHLKNLHIHNEIIPVFSPYMESTFFCLQ